MVKEKHSHIDADEEQKRYLDIEKKHQKENKVLNIALIASFFAFIYVFAILFWVLPDKTFSAEENRNLASAPKFTMANLTERATDEDGNDVGNKFTKEFAEYVADQFPARNFFVGLKADSERMLLKGNNNGVIFADDGYLVQRFDRPEEERLSENVAYICEFTDLMKEYGVEVTTAIAGRKLDVAQSVMPKIYGTAPSDEAWAIIDKCFADGGADYIDLKTPLKAHFDNGEYVYYKTDHHWTSLGAFYAYEIIADEMGIPHYAIDDFKREVVTNDFFGSTWSSAGAKWIKPDSIELFRYDGDELLTTVRAGKADVIDGLYRTSWLDQKDKYSVFIGGNSSKIDVTSKAGEREKILVIRDSFFNSISPFFARDYDLEILDLRPDYYTVTPGNFIPQICEREGISKVIVLLNVETLSEECGLGQTIYRPSPDGD